MKAKENREAWRNGLKAAVRRLADACAISAAAQGGWLPPGPVMQEVAARMVGREATTDRTKAEAPEGRPAWALNCCGCCLP